MKSSEKKVLSHDNIDNMKTAIFPGSFDPFTLGHLDVLNSALLVFDKVIIAVGYNSTKNGFFSQQARVEMIKDATADMENVEVVCYNGMTIDLCRKMKVNFIIRGLRTTTDFELESVIAQANKQMNEKILTVFIPASSEYSFISSTVVRDVLVNGGNAKKFLPKEIDIDKYLKERE
ncbi:MAG: pantetheine-phosphate adenylyltransferase [Bacteroidales bacterium]|nr:pantetheine-phosphate adenylyltransferase [Bacteroidales bacterium]MCI2121794.1 pantetheine-phosphate adenylyltransferase [Bacteroidales bacterium]MCI2146025.1 pantetheine-phosphate adenylyltransferase [Bacteroidales bacterium]